MTTFAISSDDQLLNSVNYLLSNLGQSGNVSGNITIPTGTLIGNTTTGVVTPFNTGGNAYSYLYQYINLRYANTATGSSGFSSLPANSQYFGVYNSVTSVASSNPTDYSWFQVSGGFGATKTIYYSSIGGRQVLFAAASSPPSSNYVVSVANVAIDLDVVTTAAGTPGERGPIPMAYVITTADPTSASSLVLTGWFSSSRTALTPPIGTGLTPVAGDTAYFTYPVTGVSETYTFNGSSWNTAVGQVVSGETLVANSTPGNAITTSTITGNLLVPGTITGNLIAANTITGNTIQVNTITGNLITANTITGNTIQVSTITGNLIAANTITGNTIQASTITGNLIAANTITANNISTDYLYTGNIVSFGANIGNNSSSGFWLQNNTGNARFGGNISIGNSANIGSNLIVGNNAVIGSNVQIGGNLSVVGLITSGALNSNTVDSAQLVVNAVNESKIADNAISSNKILADAVTTTKIASQAVSNAKIALATITGNLIQSQTLTGNLIALNTITGNLVATGTITATNIAANTITATQIATSTITASQIAANTITATQIATGTITASQIAANTITATQISTAYLYTGNIISTNGQIGNTSSPGYWLRYSDGDARFGGNVSIGANLNVSGLITTGSLNSNSVITTTMVPSAVSLGDGINSTTIATVSSATANTIYLDTAKVTTTTVQANQPVYFYGFLNPQWTYTVTGTITDLYYLTSLYRQNPDSSYTLVGTYNQNEGTSISSGSYTRPLVFPYIGYLDLPPNVGVNGYVFGVGWYKTGAGTVTMTSIQVLERNLVAQGLKR
jgi:acetyltransferase-like isoleucine patch superfamily enzyme